MSIEPQKFTVRKRTEDSVFHEGERRMHALLGVNERQRELGQRVIRDFMPDQHREFFENLKSVHLGVIDETGHPWVILRTGAPGFLTSPDERTLTISSEMLAGEPPNLVLEAGAKISVLGLELESRRRNRLNATIREVSDKTLVLGVDQSYGNCPKYIQKRSTSDTNHISSPVISETTKIDKPMAKIIEITDTLFLASRAPALNDDPRSGIDINHRGGNPGFVKVLDEETFEFPDYRGNNFYNSLGNITLDDRVGVQFWDVEDGDLINVKGTAEVVETGFAQPPLTGQSLRIRVQSIWYAKNAVPFRYSKPEYSPNNPII